jgi:hypothetical protein
MTQNGENQTTLSGLLGSKFWRILLTLVSVLLIFAGPTYGIYALAVLLSLDLAVSFAVGFVLFAAGIVIMWYLLKNKVIE